MVLDSFKANVESGQGIISSLCEWFNVSAKSCFRDTARSYRVSCDAFWCPVNWFKLKMSLVRYFRFAGQVVAKALWDEQVGYPCHDSIFLALISM